MKVFVYGTLKRGYGNHHILNGHRFVSEAVTVAKCRLFNSGFPVLRPRTEKPNAFNAPVYGEVYDIGNDTKTLARLDALESNGRMYHRKVKLVYLFNSGRRVKVHAYVGDSKYWRHKTRQDLLPIHGHWYKWPAVR